MLLFSLVGFTLIYGLLMAADIFLLSYFGRQPQNVFNPADEEEDAPNPEMAF
jgi:cytochrome bd-type quinol oxidase subunit 1